MANVTFDEEFDALGNVWQTQYPWASDGIAAGETNSWLANPALLPADANPVWTDNGVLSLADFPTPSDVSPDQVGGQPRIGGQVLTQGNFSQTYGYFEASIQMPAGSGIKGAFWLMPESGVWPPELDVAEVVGGGPNTLVNTVWPSTDAQNHWTDVADMTQGFHTYAVDWEPDNITWYFDGQETFQAPTPANLDQPMFIIASVSSGGSWEGDPDPSLSSQMKIDYVRAYDSNPYTTGGALTSPSPDQAAASPDASTDTSGASDTTFVQPAVSDSGTTDATVAPINRITVDGGSQTVSATSSSDVFVFDGSDHQTVISDFDPAADKIDFEMTAQDFSAVSITTDGDGFAQIEFDGNSVSLQGTTPDQLTQDNFLFNVASQ